MSGLHGLRHAGVGIGIVGLGKPNPTYTVTGTLNGSVEADIVAGGKTIIITLDNAAWTWHANIGGASQETTDLIAALTGEAINATDFESVVRDGVPMDNTHVVRDSATQVTITLPAAATYEVDQPETISVAPPANGVVGSADALVKRACGTIFEPTVSVAITGTADTAQEDTVRAGGTTIICTLTDGEWETTLGADNGFTTALINSFSGDDAGSLGWDATIGALLDFNDVTRDSATQATIILDAAAAATYNAVGTETITLALSPTCIDEHTSSIASTTMTIVEATIVLSFGALTPTETQIIAGGQALVGTITEGILGDATAIAAALSISGDLSEGNSWNTSGPAIAGGDIVRDTDLQFTWTMPAAASYSLVAGNETLTASFASTGVEAYAGSIANPATHTVTQVTVTMAITGTADTAEEDTVRAGGTTIICTLTNGAFETDIGDAGNANTLAFIAAFSGDDAGSLGWDSTIGALIDFNDIVLSGADAIATITIDAAAGSTYNAIGTETITCAIPASIVLNHNKAPAADTMTIVEAAVVLTYAAFSPTEVTIVAGTTANMVFTITEGILSTSTTTIAAALTFDGDLSEGNSWDTSGPTPVAGEITRDSATQFTWNPSAAGSYAIAGDEAVTPSFASSGLQAYAGSVSDPAAFTVGEGIGVRESWDFVVAPSGGDGTSIDAAIGTASVNTIWVKKGTYVETITGDVASQRIYFEPGTVITGAPTISAADVSWEFGTGCSVSEIITWTGANGNLRARNGGTFTKGFVGPSLNMHIAGGGWGTYFNDLVSFNTAADCAAMDFSIDAKTAATGNAFLIASSATADRNSVFSVKVDLADLSAFVSGHVGATEPMVLGCHIVDADSDGMQLAAPQERVIGNHIESVGAEGFDSAASGDNSIFTANIVKDNVGDAVLLNVNGEDQVVVGNRIEVGSTSGEAVDDDSGTGTVGANNETAF